MAWYRWQGRDLILQLRVQPQAHRDEPAGVVDDRLKLRIAASAVEGKANLRLIEFLAREFGTAKTEVTLLRGERTKSKVVRVRSPRKIPSWLGTPAVEP